MVSGPLFLPETTGYTTNNKCQRMSYEDSDIAIKLRFRVSLIGFPGELWNPKHTGNVAELHVIRDRLNTGACRWVKMSCEERTVWAEKMKEKGERRTRVRSDAGMRGQKRKNEHWDIDNSQSDVSNKHHEHEWTSKGERMGGRTSQVTSHKCQRINKALPPAIKSAKFVSSDESDGNGEDSD